MILRLTFGREEHYFCIGTILISINCSENDTLSFCDTYCGTQLICPQVDVLFKPFVSELISETRKFLVWIKEIKDFLEKKEGEEVKNEVLHMLEPISEKEVNYLETLLLAEENVIC